MVAATKKIIGPEDAAQQRILDIIVGQDDVSWKGIIFGLIETNQMDPWDINISLIAERFIQELRKLQQMDFRIGGKVVLASAILLKLKAERLYDDELGALDSLIAAVNAPDESLMDDATGIEGTRERVPYPKLTPRTPQPRKRKVSVYDLIEALEQALETQASRPIRVAPRILDVINPPDHHIDISKVIQEVYHAIYDHYEVKKSLTGTLAFTHLVKGDTKRDSVLAFIPLLHLENARKVDLDQQAHFGPITVHLIDPTPPVFNEPKTEENERTKKERQRREKEAKQETLAPVTEAVEQPTPVRKEKKAKRIETTKQVTLVPETAIMQAKTVLKPTKDVSKKITADVKGKGRELPKPAPLPIKKAPVPVKVPKIKKKTVVTPAKKPVLKAVKKPVMKAKPAIKKPVPKASAKPQKKQAPKHTAKAKKKR